MDAGDLPNLARLRSQGTCMHVRSTPPCTAPKQLAHFPSRLSARDQRRMGFQDYDPANHRIVRRSSYAFRNYAPFMRWQPASG